MDCRLYRRDVCMIVCHCDFGSICRVWQRPIGPLIRFLLAEFRLIEPLPPMNVLGERHRWIDAHVVGVRDAVVIIEALAGR